MSGHFYDSFRETLFPRWKSATLGDSETIGTKFKTLNKDDYETLSVKCRSSSKRNVRVT